MDSEAGLGTGLVGRAWDDRGVQWGVGSGFSLLARPTAWDGRIAFGAPGLIIATVGAALAVAILVGVQVQVHGVLAADRALTILVSWGLLFGAAALILGSLLRMGEKRRSEQKTENSLESAVSHETQPMAPWPLVDQFERQPVEAVAPQPSSCCLTKREQQLLPLLAQPNLTYQDIGDQLSISPETIKTHVRRMGRKLGVSGRNAVVAVARERGWLGDENLP